MFHTYHKKVFYPNLDTGASSGAQPVTVGAEAEGIDGVTTVQSVEVLALIQVPQHGLAILDKENRYKDDETLKKESCKLMLILADMNAAKLCCK